MAARHQGTDLARRMIARSGHLLEGGYIMEIHGYFADACELYREGGNLKKAAQMLERLKRDEEAGQLWKELGDEPRHRKCLQRVARLHDTRKQKKLWA